MKIKQTGKKSASVEKDKKSERSLSVRKRPKEESEPKAKLPASLKKSRSKSPKRSKSVKKEDVIHEAIEATQEDDQPETENFKLFKLTKISQGGPGQLLKA